MQNFGGGILRELRAIVCLAKRRAGVVKASSSNLSGGVEECPAIMTNPLTESLIEGNGREVSPSDATDVRGTEGSSAGWLGAELRMQLWLAAPMVCMSLLLFSLGLASVMFVGHLGDLSLASASMATSLCSVTGFSLLAGMSSALETLRGQAYGAKQYHLLGTYLQRGIIVLNVCALPLGFV